MTDTRLQVLLSRYTECASDTMAPLHTWLSADLICLAKAIEEELRAREGQYDRRC